MIVVAVLESTVKLYWFLCIGLSIFVQTKRRVHASIRLIKDIIKESLQIYQKDLQLKLLVTNSHQMKHSSENTTNKLRCI